MKRWHKIGAGIIGVGIVGIGLSHSLKTAPVVTPVTCDQTLWSHIYHKDRLKIIVPCITVTGTIINAKAEADGDFHIRVGLDSQFKNLLNAKNISAQHGYLVVEPVCENKVSQTDTIQEGVCAGFSQNVFNPSMVGEHVEIRGDYVTDLEHGWNEIHPVSEIKQIQ